MAVTVRDINSLVYRYLVPRVENNVFDETPMLALFKKGAKTKRYPRQTLRQPLLTGTSNSGRYADFTVIGRERKELTKYADYTFGNFWSEMTISQIDKLKTGTKNDVVNVLKVKQENCETTLSDDIATELISGDGTDNGFVGIETAIHTTDSTAFGGQSSTTIAKWKPQTKALGTAAPTWKDIIDFITECTQGTKKPSHWIGDKFVQSYIWSTLLAPKERYTSGDLKAAGELPVVANIPWISDAKLESSGSGGKAYLVNEKHIWLAIEKDNNMLFWPFQKPVNQFSFSAFYTFTATLAMDRRDVHGVMSGISV